MPISAIFANAHLKKNNFCAVFRALGHQGHGRHGRLLCLQTWVKGYMTEFGLMGCLICLSRKKYFSHKVFSAVHFSSLFQTANNNNVGQYIITILNTIYIL
jgi:hypothetical protein